MNQEETRKILCRHLEHGIQCKLTLIEGSEMHNYSEDKLYELEGMMIDWFPNEIVKIDLCLYPIEYLTKPIKQSELHAATQPGTPPRGSPWSV